MWIPFAFRIFPLIRKLDTFEHSPRTRFRIEEAKLARPFPAFPNVFHSRFESPFSHLPFALVHGDVLAVEGNVLDAFLTTSLCFSLAHVL